MLQIASARKHQKPRQWKSKACATNQKKIITLIFNGLAKKLKNRELGRGGGIYSKI